VQSYAVVSGQWSVATAGNGRTAAVRARVDVEIDLARLLASDCFSYDTGGLGLGAGRTLVPCSCASHTVCLL